MSYNGITVDESVGNPQPMSGTALGGGKIGGDVVLWISNGGVPQPLTLAMLQAVATGWAASGVGLEPVDSTASPLPAAAGTLVMLQASPSNTEIVYFGNAASQPFQLLPGVPLLVPMINTSAIYVKTASGTANLAWGVVA